MPTDRDRAVRRVAKHVHCCDERMRPTVFTVTAQNANNDTATSNHMQAR
jgi:hypothetical protein